MKEQFVNHKNSFKACTLFLYILQFSACNKNIDYYTISTFSSDNTLNAVIEIPVGPNKIESSIFLNPSETTILKKHFNIKNLD